MKRLLKYLKPHVLTMVIVSVMVLLITVVELYKPIIIGNAIDYYINGYYNPYAIVDEDAAGAIRYGDVYISKIMMQLPMMDHSTRCFCTMTATTWRRT